MLISSYQEAVDYILRIPKFTKKNSLENTKEFLKVLGNPEKELKIIHVAGTNGKGSVCAYLCGMLKISEKKVGLFTSPHLVDLRERFQINGKLISEAEFLDAFHQIKKIINPNENREHPTFFEYLFLMSIFLFHKAQVEFCILETGLGGRLDATNAVEEKVLTIITQIGLDHTEYLGNTLSEIAYEKAGIIRKNCPLLVLEQKEEVMSKLCSISKIKGTEMFIIKKSDYRILKINNKSIDFSYISRYYEDISISLLSSGIYQVENAVLALFAMEVLFTKKECNIELMKKGIEHTVWPGRMEEVLDNVYVDGAHNVDGIVRFLESVQAKNKRNKLIFGVVEEKAYHDMFRLILASGLFEEIILVPLENSRGLSSEKLTELMKIEKGTKIGYKNSAKSGLASMLADRVDEVIYVAGSLYLVGTIKEIVSHDKF